MPLGTSSGYNSGPLVLLNTRAKDADGNPIKPHFTADRGIGPGGALVRDEQTYDNIGGDLFRAEVKQRQFTPKGGKKPQTTTDWVLYLRDSEAGYRLALGQNSTSRDLLNRFASLIDSGDFAGLEIGYYRKKKDGREAFSLKQRGQRVEWKYNLDELPRPRDVVDAETNEVIKRDYRQVDEFFNDIVRQLAAALGQHPTNGGATQQQESNEQPGDEDGQDAGDQSALGESAVGETTVQDDGAAHGDQAATDDPPPVAPAPKPVARPAARPAPKVVTPAAPKPVATTAPAKAAPAPKPATAATNPAPRPAAKPATAGPATGAKRNVPF